MDNGKLTNIIEALLFAAAEPLPARAMCRVLESIKTEEVKRAVLALNERYTLAGSSFRIREIAGGFQLHTLPDYADFIEALLAKTRKQRLSAAALETLAVIAYRQPVSTPEIEKIRGVEASGVLRTLLERKLVCITGRSEKPGRPLLYGTTRDFLYYFGLNQLGELPRIAELEKLLSEQDFSGQISIDLGASPATQDTEPTEESAPDATETVSEPEADEAETAPDPAPAPQRLVLKKSEPEISPEAEEQAAETSSDSQVEQADEEEAPTEDSSAPEEEPATETESEPVEDMEIPAPNDRSDQDESQEIVRTAEEVLTTPVE